MEVHNVGNDFLDKYIETVHVEIKKQVFFETIFKIIS